MDKGISNTTCLIKNGGNLTLYFDSQAQKIYSKDKVYLADKATKYTITFNSASYIILEKHRQLATYFINNIQKDRCECQYPINLVHTKDEEAFDLIMRIIYGFQDVSIPLNKLVKCYLITIELGIRDNISDFLENNFHEKLNDLIAKYIEHIEWYDLFAIPSILHQNKDLLQQTIDKLGYKKILISDIILKFNDEVFELLMKHHAMQKKQALLSKSTQDLEKYLSMEQILELIIAYTNKYWPMNQEKKTKYLYDFMVSDTSKTNSDDSLPSNLRFLYEIWRLTYETRKFKYENDKEINQEEIQNIQKENENLKKENQNLRKKNDNLKRILMNIKNNTNLNESSQIDRSKSPISNRSFTSTIRKTKNYFHKESELKRNDSKCDENIIERIKGIKLTKKLSTPHQFGIWKMLSVDNENKIITCSHDKTILVRDTNTNNIMHTLTGHMDIIRNMIVLNDGRLCSCSYDGKIRIWNIDKGICEQILTGHKDKVYAVCEFFESVLVSCSDDCTLRLWDLQQKSAILSAFQVIKHERQKQAICMERIIMNELAVSSCADINIYQYDHNKHNFILIKTLSGHTDWILDLKCMNTQRHLLISSSDDAKCKLWNLHTDQCIRTFYGHSSYVISLVILSDRIFASGSREIKFWDIESDQAINTIKLTNIFIYHLCMIDLNKIACVGNTKDILFYEFYIHNLICSIKHFEIAIPILFT